MKRCWKWAPDPVITLRCWARWRASVISIERIPELAELARAEFAAHRARCEYHGRVRRRIARRSGRSAVRCDLGGGRLAADAAGAARAIERSGHAGDSGGRSRGAGIARDSQGTMERSPRASHRAAASCRCWAAKAGRKVNELKTGVVARRDAGAGVSRGRSDRRSFLRMDATSRWVRRAIRRCCVRHFSEPAAGRRRFGG